MKTFLKRFYGPIKVCAYHPGDAFVWFMFTLVASQLGTIINVIHRWVFMGWDFQAALCPESATGTFYTFALVMMSSLLGPLFLSIIGKEEPKYNKIRIGFVTVLFFLLILAAIFSAFSVQKVEYYSEFSSLKNSDVLIDGWQFAFFIVAILVAVYAFGLNHLKEHPEFEDISDDYQEKEKANMAHIKDGLTNSNTDGKGTAV